MSSKKSLAKHIAATNKAFEDASPEQKRVMIAQDVILRVEQENLLPVNGSFALRHLLPNDDTSLKTYLNKKDSACSVCAKGALFCSIIGRVNKMTLNEFSEIWLSSRGDNDKAHNQLYKYFEKDQIDLIETAFELSSCIKTAPYEDRVKAMRFGVQYSSTDRLIAICRNIIDNEGTFKP